MPPGNIIDVPRDIKHRLLTKDVDAMTGVCQECGPVQLRWRSAPRAGGPRTVACPTPKRLERERDRKLAKNQGWLYETPRPHGLNVYQAREFVQGKVCALCSSPDELVVDHDHKTGKVRDALCRRHNLAMGLFGDDPALLRAAADYVEGHRE